MTGSHGAVTTISGHGSLAEFAAGRVDEWAAMSEQSGALLFRGFDLAGAEDFHECAVELTGGVSAFPEESSPRSRLTEGVFTATDYPADVPIQFHSEHSYAYEWPLKLIFGCVRPSQTGGRTLLSDTRRVLRDLPPKTVAEFTGRGIRYERRYSARRGISWQDAFGVSEVDELLKMCEQRGIALEQADGDLIRTSQTGPAVRKHPRTGEEVWFNHAFVFNVASIEPDWLRDVMRAQPPDALVSQTWFGDGGEIPEEMIEDIRSAYARSMLEPFGWHPGDVLLIDNMLLAHAREAYTGERAVLVAMAGVTRDGGEALARQGR
jgi:alpha-ketoglutarate-dependent taurine dioxygenase